MSDDIKNVDLAFLAKQNERVLQEMQKLRREMTDVRALTLNGIDFSRRLERNTLEAKDDLELILKSEISGRFGHFETKIEQLIDERFERFEQHLDSKFEELKGALKDKA